MKLNFIESGLGNFILSFDLKLLCVCKQIERLHNKMQVSADVHSNKQKTKIFNLCLILLWLLFVALYM